MVSDEILNGRYELHEWLGAGGMGVVYRGRDRLLGREVAVKRCKGDSPDWRAMFVNEAKSQSRLFHPHIVSIFDFGYDFLTGLPFIVMEYFEGRSVQDLVERVGPLDVPRAVGIIRLASMALAVAHGRKIVHRDVKPANMLIGADGLIKVSDFGLATRRGAGAVPGFGTHMYAAPELGSGDEDHRVDIYALGVTLACLVTGSPKANAQVLPPHPFPESLRKSVIQATEPDRDRRFKDVDEFLNSLPPESHDKVGTVEAIAFCKQNKLHPAPKKEHREFVFDLGDIRDSGMKKRRTIVAYAIAPATGTAYYIIKCHENARLETKHAYKANSEYGQVIAFDASEMKALIG